jgi:hypothetical protein
MPQDAWQEDDLTRAALWADGSTRTWLLLLARRFILLVPGLGPPATYKTITVAYESEVFSRSEEQAKAPTRRSTQLWAAWKRVMSGQSIDHPFNIPTRGPFSAASYHAELLAPGDLTVVGARLRLITREFHGEEPTRFLDIASDRSTPLVHLYANGRRPPRSTDDPGATIETVQACALRVRLRIRAGLVLPVFLTSAIVAGALTVGVVARAFGYKAESATVAAVLVALPALYAAYLLPQGHPLVRRFFREFRAILVILSILPFAAAASVAIDFGSTFRYVVWGASDLVAIACFFAATLALRRSWFEF